MQHIDTSDARKFGWAVVLGSDAHHLDGSGAPAETEARYPGSHFTWVKAEMLNLEALFLAIADGSSSLIRSTDAGQDPNEFGHDHIASIVFTTGGETGEYRFSPWMNAIIGGRGVGKSTILELARLALDRFSELPGRLREDLEWFSPNPSRQPGDRFWSDDTIIEVIYMKGDRTYRITWRGDDPGKSVIEHHDGSDWVLEAGTVRERFPVLMYSQKQIYESAKDPQSLMRIIDTQPAIDFQGWKSSFDQECSSYRALRNDIVRLERTVADVPRFEGELADIQAQLDDLAHLRDSPEAKEYDRLLAEQALAERREVAAFAFEESLEEAIAQFDLSTDGDTKEQGNEQEAAWWRAVIAARESAAAVAVDLAAARSTWEGMSRPSDRETRLANLSESFGAADDETIGDRAEKQYGALVAAKTRIEGQLRNTALAVKELTDALGRATILLESITLRRSELTERRKAFIAQLDLDDSNLKLDVFAEGDEESLSTGLRTLTQKPTLFDLVFAPSTGLRFVIKGSPKSPAYRDSIVEVKALLKDIRARGKDSALLDERMQIDARFFQHLSGIDRDQFETEVDLWFPEDLLGVRYRPDGEANFRDLDQGSPGQKTATLLAVLLQLSSDPLLLDQPEDDLDNRLIYELVVKTLKRIKRTRQVIVVTHNANVVVNADAESVMVMEYSALPAIAALGSIQNELVRALICLIMEGGAPALEARYRRLTISGSPVVPSDPAGD